jgi:hypothetical protein
MHLSPGWTYLRIGLPLDGPVSRVLLVFAPALFDTLQAAAPPIDRNLERQKIWYNNQKATNVDAYRAAHSSMARNSYSKNPAKHVAAVVASRATSISTKKFYCEPCDLSCRSDHDLKVQKKTKGHLKKTGEFDNTVNMTPAHARAVKNKSHYCKACDLTCRTAYELGNHNKTKSHLRKMAQIRGVDSSSMLN